MLFGAKKRKKKLKNTFISHPNLILTTATCIRMSLEIYVNSLRKEVTSAGSNCGVRWGDKETSEIIAILFNVCNFTIPALINQVFKDRNIADKYTNMWMEAEPNSDIMEHYKYFQNILDEYNMNIMGLFPIVVGLTYEGAFEKIVRDSTFHSISFRAISFTNDLVIAFCEKNPLIEAYIGEYIAQTV